MSGNSPTHPRVRLLKTVASGLSEAGLLAILFQRGPTAGPAINLSRPPLGQLDGLRGLLNARLRDRPHELFCCRAILWLLSEF